MITGMDAERGRGADAAAHLEPVDARQHHVEQHHVEPAPAESREAALPVAGDGDVDLVLAEILRHQRAQTGVVVDEERGRPRRRAAPSRQWRGRWLRT